MGNRQVCILIRARVMPVRSRVRVELSVRRVTGFRQRRVCVALHDGGTGRAESGRLREIARRALLSVAIGGRFWVQSHGVSRGAESGVPGFVNGRSARANRLKFRQAEITGDYMHLTYSRPRRTTSCTLDGPTHTPTGTPYGPCMLSHTRTRTDTRTRGVIAEHTHALLRGHRCLAWRWGRSAIRGLSRIVARVAPVGARTPTVAQREAVRAETRATRGAARAAAA